MPDRGRDATVTLDGGATAEALVDALDTLIDKGVVLVGDVDLCVADVALVRAGLRLYLRGIRWDTTGVARPAERAGADPRGEASVPADLGPTRGGGPPESMPSDATDGAGGAPLPSPDDEAGEGDPAAGLAHLLLLLVDILRRLLERQAMRRVDDGDLSEERIE